MAKLFVKAFSTTRLGYFFSSSGTLYRSGESVRSIKHISQNSLMPVAASLSSSSGLTVIPVGLSGVQMNKALYLEKSMLIMLSSRTNPFCSSSIKCSVWIPAADNAD